MSSNARIDVDKPLWDQSTFIGRLKYFVFICDCRTLFVSDKRIHEAKQFCEDYKKGLEPPETKRSDVIYEKRLKDSAFHPHTDEFIPFYARLNYQWPTSILITSSMLALSRHTIALVICQILNQMHNAILNHTYRGEVKDDPEYIMNMQTAFVCAVVTGSIVTIGFKHLMARRGFLQSRCVPFYAIVAGHGINLSIMRHKELLCGTPLYAKHEKKPFMDSQVAAVKGLSECFITRALMSFPCLIIVPVVTYKFMPYCFPQRRPFLAFVIETSLCALGCMFIIPFAYAIFPERNSMNPQWLKLYTPEYKEFEASSKSDVDIVYYHKGL